ARLHQSCEDLSERRKMLCINQYSAAAENSRPYPIFTLFSSLGKTMQRYKKNLELCKFLSYFFPKKVIYSFSNSFQNLKRIYILLKFEDFRLIYFKMLAYIEKKQ
ncbi:MAG: hypothetical protein IJ920_06955, partial [Paludibacteraceae bacterium]|nr:hypothetical protein [Paludibacteraceae bacterium]